MQAWRTYVGIGLLVTLGLFTLTGCGGLSGDGKKIQQSCNESSGRDARFCQCYAEMVDAELSTADLKHLLAVNTMESGASLSPDISTANMEQLVRVGKVSKQARLACSSGS